MNFPMGCSASAAAQESPKPWDAGKTSFDSGGKGGGDSVHARNEQPPEGDKRPLTELNALDGCNEPKSASKGSSQGDAAVEEEALNAGNLQGHKAVKDEAGIIGHALQPKLRSPAQGAGTHHEDHAVGQPQTQGIMQDAAACERTDALVPQPSKKAVSVPDCGVRLGWLLRWAKEVVLPRLGPGATSSQVCKELVIPSTAAWSCRYADILDDSDVSTPLFFLSHHWSGNFLELVEVLEYRFRLEDGSGDSVFVWLDILAINQHRYKDSGALQADDIQCLAATLSKVQKTLFLLDKAGNTLNRIWCLFEFWQTLKAKGAEGIEVLFLKVPTRKLQNLLEWTFGHQDLRVEAQASLEEDKVRILAEIDADIGCEQMAADIFKALKTSARIEAEQALKEYHKWAQHKRHEQLKQEQQQQQQHTNDHDVQEQQQQQQQQQQQASTDLEYVMRVVSTCRKDAWILHTEEDSTTEFAEMSLQLSETAVDLCKQWFGPTHPHTLDAILSLADNQSSTNDLMEEAFNNYEFVVKERMHTLGAEHEATLEAKWGLSELLVFSDGETDEGSVTEIMGLPLKQELAEIWDRAYGLAHEGTREAYSSLGQCFEMLDNMPEALAAFEKEAQACEACFGLEDEDTAGALSRVASVMEGSFERFLDALPIRRKVLEICKKVLGPGHESTRQAAEALADCLQAAGLPDAGHLERDIFVSSL